MLYDHVYYFAFDLQLAFHHQQAGLKDHLAVSHEDIVKDNEVGRGRLVFDGDEHDAACGPRLLTHQHQSRYFHVIAVAASGKIARPEDAQQVEFLPHETHG